MFHGQILGYSNLLIDIDTRQTIQSQTLLDPCHPLAILDSDGIPIGTKVHIQLLERLVLRLGHQRPHEDGPPAAEGGEEDVRAVLHVVDHVARAQADDEVEHPVRGGHDGDAARAHAVGEDLLREHPRDGAPGVGEVDGEQPDEGDGRPPRGAVRGPRVLEGAVDGGDDDVADAHADGADDEEGLASEVVEEEDGGEREDDLEDAGHARREQLGGHVGEAEGAEDLGRVVEDGVDAGELLEDHDPAADIETLEHVWREEGFPGPEFGFAVQFEVGLLVEHDGGLDLEVFRLEEGGVGRETAELAEGGNAVVVAVLHHEPAGGEGEEEHAEEEDPGGDELEREGEAPRDGLLPEAGVPVRGEGAEIPRHAGGLAV